MSITEFHALRKHFAWKCEYLNGEAILRPRKLVLVGHLPLDSVPEPGPPAEGLLPRSLSAASPTTLTRLYREAFRDTPELCDYQGATMTREIERWLKQDVARAHPTSLILCPRSHPHAAVALALIKRTHKGFLLDTLAVRPRYQRRGAATHLLRKIIHELRNEGATELLSTYHPLNEASLAWHRRQGFTTLPSLQIARLQLSAARANGDDTMALATEVRHLESRAEQEGIEAVEPIMEVITSWMQTGIEQGIERGEQREARSVILRLGTRRFGPPTSEVEKALEEANQERLEVLVDRLLEAESWEELLA